MLLEKVFMVRGSEEGTGFFNSNFEIKLLYLVGIFLLILLDWKLMGRKDYLRVFTAGTITWSIVELVLQLGGFRQLVTIYIFGWEVPFIIQVIMKGAVEGAGVAVFCIFFSDRALEGSNKSRLVWMTVFGILMLLMALDAFRFGVQTPNYGGDVPSRRSMYEVIPIIYLTVFSAIGFGWLIKTKYPDLRKRGFWLFIFMVMFGAVWTIAEYYAGTRWIEVGEFGNSQHAPPWVEFWALTFDVVIEIAAVYVPFFAIPVMEGSIKSKNGPEKQS